MRAASRPGVFAVGGTVAAIFLSSCSAAVAIQPPAQAVSAPVEREASSPASTNPYRSAGFLVGDGAVPFVGLVRYFGTDVPDSTQAILALSLTPRSLSFVRAGDRYAAFYIVNIEVTFGLTVVRTDRPAGEVRVASIQETARADEGIIFQRTFRLRPGTYSMRVTVQDSLGAGSGTVTTQINVPSLTNGVSPTLPVFAAEMRRASADPLIVVANPRATVRYGRDTVIQLYLEAYDQNGPDTIVVTARPYADSARVLRRDTAILARGGDVHAGRVSIPIAHLGLGLVRLSASRTNGNEVSSTVAMVTIGENAPVTTFDELIDALKYYATESELRDLAAASEEKRPAQWALFARQTDPNPSTPENEALHEYFRRVAVANTKYREGAQAPWTTDRGAVVIALGEPDTITDPVPLDSTSSIHFVTWEYRRHRLSLVFSDQGGTGSWRLIPTSDAEFRSLLRIAGPCVGCR